MFSSNEIYVYVAGVLLGLAFIILAVYTVHKVIIVDAKDLLVKFVILAFTSLIALFIVDKIVAFRIDLLKGMDKDIFDLIKTLTLMIFSYYFGVNKNEEKGNK